MPSSVRSADEQTGLLKEDQAVHDAVDPHHSLNKTDEIDVCTAGGGTVESHQGEAACVRNAEVRRRRKEILFTHPDSENFWAEYEQRESVAGRSVRPNGAEIEKAHGFTRGEVRKMCEINESMEARHPHNILFRNHMAVQPTSDHLWKRGLIFLIIGFVMGCLGFIMFQSIAALAEERKKLLVHRVAKAYKGTSGDKSLYLFEAFLMWVMSGGALSLIAMLIIKWQPQAGGSGVTDVMAYLNGVFFTKVFNIRTLCAKAISCVAAVASGLPVGPEGPMIHIGAILGAGIGSGRSKSFRFSLNTFFSSIRDPRDHRDVIAGGAAAGVAVAFGAPIGGLLFVFEEVATHWRPGLTPLIFIACLTGAYVYGVFSSQFEGWVPRHETSFGGLLDAATILFDSKADRFMYSRDLLSAGVIGMSTGLLATLFTKANVFISRKRIAASPTFRMVEPVLVLFAYLTISFLIPLVMKCSPVPLGHEEGSDDQAIDNSSKFFIHAPCHNPNEFSSSATLFWSPGESVIKLMFRKHQGMDVPSLLLFTLMYFVFSCISSGMMISSGIVIPMLVTGGGIGRLWGLFINVFVDDSQHEGVFALMGAAGYFAGVSRLTVSLAVIMIELTSEKRCLLPLMVAIMSSKVVADRFGHSLYHCLLDVCLFLTRGLCLRNTTTAPLRSLPGPQGRRDDDPKRPYLLSYVPCPSLPPHRHHCNRCVRHGFEEDCCCASEGDRLKPR